MKPLILLVGLLALPSAALAAPAPVAPAVQADWRRDGVDDRVKAALTSKGWRFEDDGRALDPKTKAPADKATLDKATLDLRQGAQRAALETVNLMLSSGKPLDFEEQKKIETLSDDLPPGLAAAILDPKSDISKLRAMTDAGLSRVAAYFDGGRTLADRQAAAQPVSAGTPGPRVDLPYYSALEKSVGEKIRASAQTEISRDPFGMTVLARLNTAGKPDLPPIVIEDQRGGVAAQYDFRRQAVVLDREAVLASVVGTVPPRQRIALRTALSSRAALLSYLDSHPEAANAVVKDNDVLIVHELTHAWQDRRDPIFREIVRGNLPDVQPLEYEDEAYVTKNLYIHSKIKNDPASVRMDQEFSDYIVMSHGMDSWRKQQKALLTQASPSRAVPLKSAEAIQRDRAARVQARAVSTSDEQKAKALDLLALNRGAKELLELQSAHAARMKPIDAGIAGRMADRSHTLGIFYLGRALSAESAIDRSVLLDQAERYAKASGNAKLMEEVRKAKEPK
ncbi:MAG: hypothetical protein ABL955_05250 [Elusimicrobiota bacterium]